MSVIFVALPIALMLAAAAVIGFAWSAREGQFEDLDTERWRILIDDRDAMADSSASRDCAKND